MARPRKSFIKQVLKKICLKCHYCGRYKKSVDEKTHLCKDCKKVYETSNKSC